MEKYYLGIEQQILHVLLHMCVLVSHLECCVLLEFLEKLGNWEEMVWKSGLREGESKTGTVQV